MLLQLVNFHVLLIPNINRVVSKIFAASVAKTKKRPNSPVLAKKETFNQNSNKLNVTESKSQLLKAKNQPI